ncbi:MAG: VWA domain-containing protein [Planctomycetes bacterium]|nr:VWA domain-containing protein [Planctomycetota bacterium]
MIAAAELGFALLDPTWLLLWPLTIAALLFRHRRRRAVAMAGFALLEGELATGLGLPPLPRSRRQRWRWLVAGLDVVALLLWSVAMARPIERLPLPPQREGLDVLLCIDRSSSMSATDLGGGRTRLATAVEAAGDFVRGRAEDRAGLVTFARYPDLRCPPTLDHDTAIDLLAAVEPVLADGPEDATGIGTAVTFAIEALQRAGPAGKVIVLLTDGEENVATAATPREIAPLHAAQLAQELGVRVHCIVVGRGAQAADGSFVPLDTTAVRQLARSSGGRFFAADDGETLGAIYRDIDRIEKGIFVEPRVVVREWFAAFVLAGLVLAVLVGLGRTSLREALP